MSPYDYSVIYIDTEGSFRPERIEAIARARGLDPTQILDKILVTKALDSSAQESCIEAACSKCETNNNKIKLLIVDSIIYHYRAEYAGRSKTPERIQRLNKSMHLLLKTAQASGVAVIVTNHQTQSSIDRFNNTVIPVGGNVMSYASKYRIHLDGRNNNSCRRAILDISPSQPQTDTYFAIDDRGFTDVADDV
jgi:DNA repair protein RadA